MEGTTSGRTISRIEVTRDKRELKVEMRFGKRFAEFEDAFVDFEGAGSETTTHSVLGRRVVSCDTNLHSGVDTLER